MITMVAPAIGTEWNVIVEQRNLQFASVFEDQIKRLLRERLPKTGTGHLEQHCRRD